MTDTEEVQVDAVVKVARDLSAMTVDAPRAPQDAPCGDVRGQVGPNTTVVVRGRQNGDSR